MPMRSKSLSRIHYNNVSDSFNYMSNVPVPTPVRKRNNLISQRIYQSFDLSDSAKPEPYRRTIKETSYTKYETTSQINLPGCVKRNQNEINDDSKPRIIPESESHNMKLIRDYRSNISCLPGCQKNDYQDIPHVRSIANRYAENDIFNTKPNSTIPKQSDCHRPNQNSFNSSYTKTANYNTIMGDYSSNRNNHNEQQTGIKRFNMKNRSQIQIL